MYLHEYYYFRFIIQNIKPLLWSRPSGSGTSLAHQNSITNELYSTKGWLLMNVVENNKTGPDRTILDFWFHIKINYFITHKLRKIKHILTTIYTCDMYIQFLVFETSITAYLINVLICYQKMEEQGKLKIITYLFCQILSFFTLFSYLP